ncbi:hypothetical protein KRX57_05875 [Weeksellaceae bacterium TAE3-ERU29]|nr:hypothetical protein [Weeksellaceae bacterium TAE3-ERU29]
MKAIKFLSLGLLTAGSLIFTSCNNDDDKRPEHVEDHEEISQVEVTVTPANGEAAKYVFNDDEKEGQKITLKEGVNYTFEVTALNSKHEDHYHNEIGEISEEKEAHFFVYQTDLTDYTFVRQDGPETTREDKTKLGLKVSLQVDKTQTGKYLSFELKHQPASVDPAANNGLGSAKGGATDISAKFPVEVAK